MRSIAAVAVANAEAGVRDAGGIGSPDHHSHSPSVAAEQFFARLNTADGDRGVGSRSDLTYPSPVGRLERTITSHSFHDVTDTRLNALHGSDPDIPPLSPHSTNGEISPLTHKLSIHSIARAGSAFSRLPSRASMANMEGDEDNLVGNFGTGVGNNPRSPLVNLVHTLGGTKNHNFSSTTKMLDAQISYFPPGHLDPESVKDKLIVNDVLHPESYFHIAWDIFLSALIFYSVLVIPYRIGFGIDATGGWLYFDIIVDIFFFLDMIVTFNTAIMWRDHLVTLRSQIAKAYLSSWFTIDFLSTLPIDKIVSLGISSSATNLRSIKLIRVLRLVRLIKLVRLLKLNKFSTVLSLHFNPNPAIQRLMKLFAEIVFIGHLLSCFWFYISTFDEDNRDTWIAHNQMLDKDVSSQYITSFYWTVATMMAVGYGDVHAVNKYEMLYSIFTQVIGAAAFGFIIANITAFIETVDPRAAAYTRKMDGLKEYLRERGLPTTLQKRVRKYFEYVISRQSIFDDLSILVHLPPHLRDRIVLHMHGETASHINMLHNEQAPFVAYVIARTKLTISFSNEIIAEEGTVGNEIYFILRGKVAALIQQVVPNSNLENGQSPPSQSDGKNEDENTGSTLKNVLVGIYCDGSHFGEFSVLGNTVHPTTYMATNTCDMLKIAKEDMEYAMYLFSSASNNIENRTQRHFYLLKDALESETTYLQVPGTKLQRPVKDLLVLNGTKFCRPDDAVIMLSPKFLSSYCKESSMTEKQENVNQLEQLHFHAKEHELIKTRKRRPTSEIPEHLLPKQHQPIIDRILNLFYSRNRVTPQGRRASAKRTLSATWGKGRKTSKKPAFVAHKQDHVAPEVIWTEEAEETEREIWNRWIVIPNNKWKYRWDITIAVLIFYSVLMVPYRIGFSSTASGAWLVLDWIVDGLFALDIFLNFRTAYEWGDDEVLVTMPSLIARHYIRSWFLIDFLSTFPFDDVMSLVLVETAGLMTLRLIRVLRMIRLLKLFRLLKLKRVVGNLDDYLSVSPAVFKLSSLLFKISFVAHLFGCCWYFITLQAEDTRDVWWYGRDFYQEDQHLAEKYISSLYFAFTTISTVGYGDIVPKSDAEKVFCIVIILCGATVFGYVVGSIATLIAMMDLGEALFKAKMNELDEYMREQGVPRGLRRDCKKCYAFALGKTSVFNEAEMLETLSTSLRQQVMYTIHHEAIKSIPIFNDGNLPFISMLLKCMSPQLGLTGSIILKRGEVGSQIFFIVKGSVQVMKPSDNDGDDIHCRADGNPVQSVSTNDAAVKQVLGPGNFFGHEAVLSAQVNQNSVRAMITTQMYVLPKSEIGKLVDRSPALAEQLETALKSAIDKQTEALEALGAKPKSKWFVVKNKLSNVLDMSPNKKRSALESLFARDSPRGDGGGISNMMSLIKAASEAKSAATAQTAAVASSAAATAKSNQSSQPSEVSVPVAKAVETRKATLPKLVKGYSAFITIPENDAMDNDDISTVYSSHM